MGAHHEFVHNGRTYNLTQAIESFVDPKTNAKEEKFMIRGTWFF